MATSGSINFNQTRNQIIQRALRITGVLAEGEPPTAQQISDANEALNAMCKAWQADGLRLWKYKELVLFLQAGKTSYLIGSTGDHATYSYVKTELSVAGTAGNSTITVDSTTGISNGDNIGIVLDNNTIQWTTVNGTPTSTVITLTATLTGAAAVDNFVYAYTTKATRPLRLQEVRRNDNEGTDTNINLVSRSDYYGQVAKTTQAVPTEVYYQPNLTNGTLYVYPAPDSVEYVLKATAETQIEDFDNAGDDPDFPQEWLSALAFGLAADIGYEYGLTLDKISTLEQKAQFYINKARDFDQENGSVYLRMDNEG